jgi:hypothetical protein
MGEAISSPSLYFEIAREKSNEGCGALKIG